MVQINIGDLVKQNCEKAYGYAVGYVNRQNEPGPNFLSVEIRVPSGVGICMGICSAYESQYYLVVWSALELWMDEHHIILVE